MLERRLHLHSMEGFPLINSNWQGLFGSVAAAFMIGSACAPSGMVSRSGSGSTGGDCAAACAIGLRCAAGSCVPLACKVTSDCPSAFSCIHGFCTDLACDPPCPSGTSCIEATCLANAPTSGGESSGGPSTGGTTTGGTTTGGTTTGGTTTGGTTTGGTTAGARPSSWPTTDTFSGIHAFLTFDGHVTNPASVAPKYDFVWGVGSPSSIPAYRSANPSISLSSYIPFSRDPGTNSLSYWKTNHPDWVVYKCDQTTPAYFGSDPNVPLDITNPAVIAWQAQSYGAPAAAQGFDAIAADNVDLHNWVGACGVFRSGSWVSLYSGQADDPAYVTAVLGWLSAFRAKLHALSPPLALIPNFSFDDPTDPNVQTALGSIDGVVDEQGFTNWGSGASRLTGATWTHWVAFIEQVQALGMPYYSINQAGTVDQATLQWVLASYLMAKEHSESIFVSTVQGYGTALWYPEFAAPIGHPCAPYRTGQGYALRSYSGGIALVNPAATGTVSVPLPAGETFDDLYGNQVSSPVSLPASSGMILVVSGAPRC
ncbi:MAG: putative glycoside hydrolase [Deltaproteobacteria bacterium]